ncbi:hypothetical protein [Candidatus Curculioniphilus buchneri]
MHLVIEILLHHQKLFFNKQVIIEGNIQHLLSTLLPSRNIQLRS